jgi:CRP/FNR family transcriptional regulator/CRP/FNR family cyclic AMP-dependent transcriptional regulator
MAHSPILERVPAEAIDRLAASGSVRAYRKGTYLFHQGEEAADVFFLWKGRLEISAVSFAGHRQLLTTLERPQLFSELSVLGGRKRSATALAVDDVTVWTAPADEFLRFLSQEFEAVRALLRSLVRQIEAHEAFVEDLLHLDLKGRVAKRLLQLVTPSLDDLPPDGAVLPAVVTHADLANLCGGSRENVTRILSDMQRRGLVDRDGRRYVLLNVAGLRKLAGV